MRVLLYFWDTTAKVDKLRGVGHELQVNYVEHKWDKLNLKFPRLKVHKKASFKTKRDILKGRKSDEKLKISSFFLTNPRTLNAFVLKIRPNLSKNHGTIKHVCNIY